VAGIESVHLLDLCRPVDHGLDLGHVRVPLSGILEPEAVVKALGLGAEGCSLIPKLQEARSFSSHERIEAGHVGDRGIQFR
jgi:hypothetical protein